MNILGIDTSFLSFTSIGYHFGGDQELEIKLNVPQSQEAKLLFSIHSGLEILQKDIQDIDVFAVTIGPGSFTGIRIGLATVKTLAWGLGKKIIAVSTTEALAASLPEELIGPETLVVPVIDARMSRVFSALFRNGKRLSEDMDIEPEKLLEMIAKDSGKCCIFLGDGIRKFEAVFKTTTGKDCRYLPNASVSGLTLCTMARGILEKNPEAALDPRIVEPVYLRKSEAEVLHDKKTSEAL